MNENILYNERYNISLISSIQLGSYPLDRLYTKQGIIFRPLVLQTGNFLVHAMSLIWLSQTLSTMVLIYLKPAINTKQHPQYIA